MNRTSSSVVIIPSPIDRPRLQDLIEAMHQVDDILALNEDNELEPGQLHGLSGMLCHAEQALATASAALPARNLVSRGLSGWANATRHSLICG